MAEIIFAEHTLLEEIVLNEVSVRGSLTINFALQLAPICSKGKPRLLEFAKVLQRLLFG